jgi:hypothetical protein
MSDQGAFGSYSAAGPGSGKGLSGGMVAFFVIVGLVFVVLVVMGGCYQAKGKVGYLTRKFLSGITGKKDKISANRPNNKLHKKKLIATPATAVVRTPLSATNTRRPANAGRRRNLTAGNMRRQATKLTGRNARRQATKLSSSSNLPESDILDVVSQSAGAGGTNRNQKIGFMAGNHLPHNPNQSTSESVANQAIMYNTLQAGGSATGNTCVGVDVDLDFVATYGAAAQTM